MPFPQQRTPSLHSHCHSYKSGFFSYRCLQCFNQHKIYLLLVTLPTLLLLLPISLFLSLFLNVSNILWYIVFYGFLIFARQDFDNFVHTRKFLRNKITRLDLFLLLFNFLLWNIQNVNCFLCQPCGWGTESYAKSIRILVKVRWA